MRATICCLFLVLLPVTAPAAGSMPGVTPYSRVVEAADGSRLQATITLPEGGSAPMHPLLFTQWVSCGSLDYREDSNAHALLAALARDSGLALVRVERTALEGSGPACKDLDYDTELAHYVEAFIQLLDDARINSSRVYVYGSSLGSTMAPLVALELQERGFDIAGLVVQGGGAVTYYERMLNFERIYLERRPDDVEPADIHDEMQHRAKFQYEYLVEGRHPDDVAKDSPDMARIRSDILGMSESDHYGRPFAWHQQAARYNFLAAWAHVDAPVLVIFNDFDQFESRHGHWLIVAMVNRLRPGTATFVERPNIGHSDNRYATIDDAYAWRDGTPAWRESARIMTEWLRDTG
jgi:pimeloyl-ACP methyl ester carboxylesterase